MLDEICATLGGRAAEELFIGRISSGAMNDLESVTKRAYGMIAYAGMGDKLPNLCYYSNEEQFTKPYSEHTAQIIDEEVRDLIAQQYARAKQVLLEHKEGHAELAQLLIDKEVILAEDVERIFGKRPFTSRTEEILALNDEEEKRRKAADGDTSDTKSEMEELIRQKTVDAIVAKAKKAEEEKNGNSNDEEKKEEEKNK